MLLGSLARSSMNDHESSTHSTTQFEFGPSQWDEQLFVQLLLPIIEIVIGIVMVTQ